MDPSDHWTRVGDGDRSPPKLMEAGHCEPAAAHCPDVTASRASATHWFSRRKPTPSSRTALPLSSRMPLALALIQPSIFGADGNLVAGA
jgi:hypothetical protein